MTDSKVCERDYEKAEANPITAEERAREALTSSSFHPVDLVSEVAQAITEAVQQRTEECARVAKHLNWWGTKPCPELADHIAAAIRDLKE